MAFNLRTVTEYIEDARTLLLDRIAPYRYSDTSLIVALNLALLDGRRFVCWADEFSRLLDDAADLRRTVGQ